ncbi:unnamed protein product, partial [Acanthoscelides obtectus]
HFRAIIYYNFQRQLSQQECLAELLPHQSTISRWYGEFKPGRVRSLSDDPGWENVDAVRKLIIEDRHKLVSRWIPHLLTEEQKQPGLIVSNTLDRFNSGKSKNVYSIVSADESWIYCYKPENKRSEEKPTKVISSRSASKKMVATFQRTVTADWYTTICLPKVITELRKIERRIILHQDNASSHTAQKTRHPNDFFTFPKIKNRLRGQRFQSPEEAVDAMCINLRREYFAKK